MPFLTEKGGEFHESKEMRNYQFARGLKTIHEKYLEDQELGLKGTADFIIDHGDWLEVGEFKLSLPDPLPKGYILQLATIAILAQNSLNKPVRTLIFRSKDREEINIPLEENLKKEVLTVRDKILQLMEEGLPPSRTPFENRCNYCEFRKICP